MAADCGNPSVGMKADHASLGGATKHLQLRRLIDEVPVHVQVCVRDDVGKRDGRIVAVTGPDAAAAAAGGTSRTVVEDEYLLLTESEPWWGKGDCGGGDSRVMVGGTTACAKEV